MTGTDWRATRAEILLRFADESWPTQLHARVRLATAPLAEIVAAVGAADRVVDIGCGHGLVSLALATEANRPSVLGVDLDPGKIAIACRAAATDPRLDRLEFTAVRTGWRPPSTGAIVLADVLYLIDPAEQAGLVSACAAALAPGGIVVVRGRRPTPLEGRVRPRPGDGRRSTDHQTPGERPVGSAGPPGPAMADRRRPGGDGDPPRCLAPVAPLPGRRA